MNTAITYSTLSNYKNDPTINAGQIGYLNAIKQRFLLKVDAQFSGTSEADLVVIYNQYNEEGTFGTRTGSCQ